jgi:hypothetical protein
MRLCSVACGEHLLPFSAGAQHRAVAASDAHIHVRWQIQLTMQKA